MLIFERSFISTVALVAMYFSTLGSENVPPETEMILLAFSVPTDASTFKSPLKVPPVIFSFIGSVFPALLEISTFPLMTLVPLTVTVTPAVYFA